MPRFRRALLPALILMALLPAAASATTLSFNGSNTLTVTGTEGVDKVGLSSTTLNGGKFTIQDATGAALTAPAGCQQDSASMVHCPLSITVVNATMGGGEDQYDQYNDGIADTVSGGAGNDKINGSVAGDDPAKTAVDVINGDDGNDELFAGSGAGSQCNGGAGDDYMRCFYGLPGQVFTHNGGPGRDDIVGGDSNDLINGDAGNDERLSGQKGNDVIHGGDGDDGVTNLYAAMDGGEGADQIYGDAGRDKLWEDRNMDRKQFWSLDDQANDGADSDDNGQPDEGDNIHSDVEDVQGGYDDDTIVGSAANNKLHGGSIGNDILVGLAGDDDLFTGISGDKDVADGGDGNDKVQGNGTLVGGNGNDQVTGQGGADLLDLGPGTDTADAGDGNDVVKAADGAVDTIGCGVGADVAEVDSSDVVNKDPGSLCETTKVVAAGSGGGAQDGTGNPNATATQLILGTTGTFKKMVATFGATAPGPGVIVAKVTTVPGKASAAAVTTLGKLTKVIAKGGKIKLAIKLKGKVAKKLVRKKKFKVVLTTRFTPPGGKPGASVKKTVTLKRK
jgi:Ca2+-binding RTX toxin-like protein